MIDLKAALREAFGKCPSCNKPATAGMWLKWCRGCSYVAPIGKPQPLDDAPHA